MKTAKIQCSNCQKYFFRSNAEINRNKNKQRQIYCSLSCSGKKNVSHLEKYYIPGNVQFVALIYNFTKGSFEDQDVQLFCKSVYNHRLID